MCPNAMWFGRRPGESNRRVMSCRNRSHSLTRISPMSRPAPRSRCRCGPAHRGLSVAPSAQAPTSRRCARRGPRAAAGEVRSCGAPRPSRPRDPSTCTTRPHTRGSMPRRACSFYSMCPHQQCCLIHTAARSSSAKASTSAPHMLAPPPTYGTPRSLAIAPRSRRHCRTQSHCAGGEACQGAWTRWRLPRSLRACSIAAHPRLPSHWSSRDTCWSRAGCRPTGWQRTQSSPNPI